MVIEQTALRAVPKPWGSTNLRPWTNMHDDGGAIGELWFERSGIRSLEPALLLKLLFVSEPLSIQVHPDDAYAQAMGLARGKTEAWYILSATSDARVAIGLKHSLDAAQLRTSIEDGSIADLVQWRGVQTGDVILVPAGTIHTIGPGIVLAEIQQRSNTTFRLFDYGRHRELQVDDAVAASKMHPPEPQPATSPLGDARTLLIATPCFIMERFDLAPASTWQLNAEHETWFLVLEGQARIGSMLASKGKAFFLDSEQAHIHAGPDGLSGLLAYPGPQPVPDLLDDLRHTHVSGARRGLSPPPAQQATPPTPHGSGGRI